MNVRIETMTIILSLKIIKFRQCTSEQKGAKIVANFISLKHSVTRNIRYARGTHCISS